MRQLDLFGTFLEPPEGESTIEEKKPPRKMENVSPVSSEAEIQYSVVELAEATLGANTINSNEQLSPTDTSNANNTKETVQTTVLSLQKDQMLVATRTAESIENLQAETKLADTSPDANAESVLPQQSVEFTYPIQERNGAVIFDDGKISVKVKAKVQAATEVIKEKEKKELQKRGRKPIKEIEAEADLVEVPEDEVLFQKQYYPISEVAKWFRVNTSLLRFWENEFDILKPRKNRKGDRLFRPEDVKNLQLIYQLLRQRKYTIEGAKEYIKANRKKADAELQLSNTLQKFKSFLLELKANL